MIKKSIFGLLNYTKSTLKDNVFWLVVIVTMLFFGIFIKLEYATDTYSIFNVDYNIPLKHFMQSGRFVTAFFWMIISVLNFGIYKAYILSFCIAIFSISLSIYKIYNILNRKINNKILCLIISILVILNAFSIELFLFFEKGTLSLSILMSIIAIEYLIEFLESNRIRNIVFSMLAMLIATFSYQGTIAIFIAIATIYVVIYSKNVISFLKNNIIVVSIYGVPAIVNFLVVNTIFSNSRVSDENNNLIDSLLKIFGGMKNMVIDAYGILPKYFLLISIAVLFFILLLKIIFDKSKIKQKIIDFLEILYIVTAVLFAVLVPHLLMNTESIWLVARSTYAFASIIGILYMYLLYKYTLTNILTKIIIFLCLSYLFVQYVGFQNVSRDHYILNYMDNYIVKQIQLKIDDYEKNTGKVVKNVIFYNDSKQRYSYQDLMCYGDTNVSAFIPQWSISGLLNIKLDRKLAVIEMTNKPYKQYFIQKNWDYFNEEQIIFENETMNLCIF